MNAKAAELGLTDTTFENPHGLDAARPCLERPRRDLARPLRARRPVHPRRAARSSVSLSGGRTFPTTDDLLRAGRRSSAGRRGTRATPGWSQAAAAERAGVTVYGTVLGSDSRATRNDALRELLAFGLDQYRRVQVIDHGRVYAEAKTGYGQPDVELVAPRTILRTVRNGTPLVERVVAPTALALPVAKGQRLGRVEVYDGDRLVASSNLVAAVAVADAGLFAKATWHVTQTAKNLWGIVT